MGRGSVKDDTVRRLVKARRETAVSVLWGVLMLLVVLGLFASFIADPSLRWLCYALLAMTGLAFASALGSETRKLSRDLQAPPVTERCRLIYVERLPRARSETWCVETRDGRRHMINLTSVPGAALKGRWILLTYTPHSLLILAARAMEQD